MTDIEAWGRGIQKICEACQALGTPNPEYTVLGNDLTVKFTALESAKLRHSSPNSTTNHERTHCARTDTSARQ